MSLSADLKEKVMEVMQKINRRAVARMFQQAVDPERDNCPDYFSIVERPMDLGTVMRKLNTNQYKSVAEWKSDMNLIWSNSMLYNPKPSILYLITKDLSDLFHTLTQCLSDSPSNDWNSTLQALGNEMNQVMKEMPSHPQSSKKSTSSKQKQTEAEKPAPPKKAVKEKVPEPQKPKDFTKQDLLKLTRDINSIKDDDQLAEITELLQDCEGGLDDDGDEIQVDLNTLRQSTLVLLRKKVDQLLGISK